MEWDFICVCRILTVVVGWRNWKRILLMPLKDINCSSWVSCLLIEEAWLVKFFLAKLCTFDF